MGVALENARLFAETQRLLKETEQRNAELAVINSIQQGIAGSLSFQAIVELVGDKLREVLRIDTIGIRWYDHATRTAHFLYEIEHGTRVTMAPVTASEARWKEVDLGPQRHRPQHRGRGRGGGRRARHRVLASTVTAKIVAADRVVGVVVVESFEREYAFGDDEVRLLQTIVGEHGRRARERAPVRRDAAPAEGDRAAQRRARGDQQHPAGDGGRARLPGDRRSSSATSCARCSRSDDIGIRWHDPKADLIHQLYVVRRAASDCGRSRSTPSAATAHGALHAESRAPG